MKTANKFSLSPKWQLLLKDMGIDVNAVLTFAKLPADLFKQQDLSLSAAEYFQLWQAIDMAAGNQEVALMFAQSVSAESFDAPIFAALCCQDMNSAVKRLKQYKPLIGPMILDIEQSNEETQLTISCAANELQMPYALCMSEAVFFTQLARIGTREHVVPLRVQMPFEPNQRSLYEEYFGCKIIQGNSVQVSFNGQDAARPFLTSSGAMWEFFEEKLNKKLADVIPGATTAQRVEATLIEALPSGEASIEFVAAKLAMSKRTLQRKLTDEAETFQSILLSVRAALAEHYLLQSELSLGEISYLLGFKEPNSFIRAFSSWKGISPSSFRHQVQH